MCTMYRPSRRTRVRARMGSRRWMMDVAYSFAKRPAERDLAGVSLRQRPAAGPTSSRSSRWFCTTCRRRDRTVPTLAGGSIHHEWFEKKSARSGGGLTASTDSCGPRRFIPELSDLATLGGVRPWILSNAWTERETRAGRNEQAPCCCSWLELHQDMLAGVQAVPLGQAVAAVAAISVKKLVSTSDASSVLERSRGTTPLS